MNFKFLDKNKGYIGIPELLVVMAIIAILTIVILMNYPAAKKQLALQRSASRLIQDIRRVQEMALASEEVEGVIPPGSYEIGYGIYLNSPQTSYILFADPNKNYIYNSGEEIGTIIPLEPGTKIFTLPTNPLHIIFSPPDPTISFRDQFGNELAGPIGGQVSFTISSTDETIIKTIIVNKAGLIYVE